MVVPTRALDFYMLAHQVESRLAHFANIEEERFVGRGRHEAIRPICLIEHAFDEQRAAVEANLLMPVGTLSQLDGTKAEIAVHDVVAERQPNAVEVGVFRRPEAGIWDLRRNGAGRLANGFLRLRHDLAICVDDLEFQLAEALLESLIGFTGCQLFGLGGRAVILSGRMRVLHGLRPMSLHIATTVEHEIHAYGDDACRGIGVDDHRAHPLAGDDLQPDCLPNAALRRVPDVASVEALLPAQMRPFLARVGHADGEHVLARSRKLGDVEGEGGVPARMQAGEFAVHPDGTGVIDCLEMQQETLSAFKGRRLERTATPEQLVRLELALDAGKRRLGRERHE